MMSSKVVLVLLATVFLVNHLQAATTNQVFHSSSLEDVSEALSSDPSTTLTIPFPVLTSDSTSTGSSFRSVSSTSQTVASSTSSKTTTSYIQHSGIPLDLWYKLKMSFTIKLKLNFTDRLSQSYTSEYQDLARQVDTIVGASFMHCRAFLLADVTSFRNCSVIASYVTYFDPVSLVLDRSVNVSEIEWDIQTGVFHALKLNSIVDSDYIDNITTQELQQQAADLGNLLVNPCNISGICRNPCYECVPSTLQCQQKPICDVMDFYGCAVNDSGQPECRCQRNFQMIDGQCIHQNVRIRLILGILGACMFATMAVIAVTFVCCVKRIGDEKKRKKADEIAKEQALKRAEINQTYVVVKQTPDAGHVNHSFEVPPDKVGRQKVSSLDDGVRLRVSGLTLDGTPAAFKLDDEVIYFKQTN